MSEQRQSNISEADLTILSILLVLVVTAMGLVVMFGCGRPGGGMPENQEFWARITLAEAP